MKFQSLGTAVLVKRAVKNASEFPACQFPTIVAGPRHTSPPGNFQRLDELLVVGEAGLE